MYKWCNYCQCYQFVASMLNKLSIIFNWTFTYIYKDTYLYIFEDLVITQTSCSVKISDEFVSKNIQDVWDEIEILILSENDLSAIT